jgi:hypothetical protein
MAQDIRDGEQGEISRERALKEWRRPGLRKLPIAATAQSSKGDHNADDGGGGGKGDLLLHS